MIDKEKIFSDNMNRCRQLHRQIQTLYEDIFEEHNLRCTATTHNNCIFDPEDMRLKSIVIMEREIIVIRRQLKRDIRLFEDDPEKRKKRLAIIEQIEEIEPRLLSNRDEYAKL